MTQSNLTLIIVALFGLGIGSFLNVLISRYKELSTIVTGRSRCPHCRHQLAWVDLVPLLSFAWLGGRCRYCRQPISWQYPLVELLTAGLLIQLVLMTGLSWLTLLNFTIFCLLLVIVAIDYHHQVIADQLVLPALLLAVIRLCIASSPSLLSAVWGVLLAGGGLAFLVVVSRQRWMGSGDIGLGVLMGLLAGLDGATVGLAVAFLSGTVVGLLAISLKRRQLKDSIAFGPFLGFGTYVGTLWGSQILTYYLNWIHYY